MISVKLKYSGELKKGIKNQGNCFMVMCLIWFRMLDLDRLIGISYEEVIVTNLQVVGLICKEFTSIFELYWILVTSIYI